MQKVTWLKPKNMYANHYAKLTWSAWPPGFDVLWNLNWKLNVEPIHFNTHKTNGFRQRVRPRSCWSNALFYHIFVSHNFTLEPLSMQMAANYEKVEATFTHPMVVHSVGSSFWKVTCIEIFKFFNQSFTKMLCEYRNYINLGC